MTRCRPRSLYLSVLAATAAGVPAVELPADQVEFFEKSIRPVLVEHCFKCHSERGEKGIKGGLSLESRDAVRKGGDTGPALELGNPDKSLIIQAIRHSDSDLQMPPKHKLPQQVVENFERWVRMGAPDPRDGSTLKSGIDFATAREFWSLKPVTDVAVPTVSDSQWGRNEVDRFLFAKLEEKGMKPNGEADRRVLLRRATFDLTGLPPTPAETREFLADQSPDAFPKVIERLLASPAYGEKWGRHWLDIVRYADTSGCNSDYPVTSAYRYRNWVIGAFNRDLPYDEFLRQQIAGDLLPAADDADRHEKIVATGYLAIARRFGSRANEFHLTLEDTIDNFGRATMGLSLGCARCHDHKFDPVSAKDYYALYGIFNSTTYAFPGTEIYKHTKDFTPLVAEPQRSELLAQWRELADLDDRIEKLKEEKKRIQREEKQAAEAKALESKTLAANAEPAAPVEAEKPKRTSEDAQRELDAAIARQQELESIVDTAPKAYAVMEGKPENARIQKKGEPRALGETVPRGFLTVLGGQAVPAEEKGSGRRQLADWVSDADNPLTARVMVNRIWEHHFGRGIVKTPNDFGTRGEKPTHPELLDWLAQRFVDSGWSIKSMHRLLMNSRAYQMSSDDQPEFSEKDVNNDLFWRFNRRRLTAEEFRDSLLALAGTLDIKPGERHPFPPEADFRYTQHRPFVADYPSTKRSVYLMQQRFRKQPFLELFDGADTNATTAVRSVSQTPVQALWAINSSFAHEQARLFAEEMFSAFSDEQARIAYAYECAIGRPAESFEIEEVRKYLGEVTAVLAETGIADDQRPLAAFASFSRVLLTSNEFVFLD
ncbi:MAG TPA: DUF1553 domain-containing protein [Chthoniobacteraceae bacterium]|nr:DUF1553 domain-containing protein [Chthoniobacteraceae bacterium]